ncbi:putative Xaa-Pro aminopeptidase [Myriangium duriaei CBS 260.36]|uniref:Xaa-Pro aminopeptidase n=1 Tax=Myriangium duriaei CBS 260.36 TaxID=1168546 RepID=A0A9P4IVA7_9PEZI|nr:putative Xaa-Pro aminopeptidase [Myriangium duriaei CBS 260.36]
MDVRIDALSVLDKYPAKQHALRVARALGTRTGLIYLQGAALKYLDDSDQFQNFRQRRYFYYLSGCDENDCHVTYDIARQQLTLWLAPFTVHDVVWKGRGSTIEEAHLKYDLDKADYSNHLADYIKSWSSTNHSAPIYALHKASSHLPPQAWGRNHIIFDRLLNAMNLCRSIKDPHEINMIQRANDISAQAHVNVLRSIRNFTSESQVAATILYTSVANGAPEQAYRPIAGSGSNGAVLHYGSNNEPFGDRQSMVLDAGAEYKLYASDVTRSFPLNGRWSKEGKQIYDLVADMQTGAMNLLGPGKYMGVANVFCHIKCVQGLMKLGILVGGCEKEIFESGISYAFFPHGLGHHMGLEVHDVSYTPPHRTREFSKNNINQEVSQYNVDWILDHEEQGRYRSPCSSSGEGLQPGMVITVEPGIYFNRYSLENVFRPERKWSKFIDWDRLEKYYPVGGVRIEDDILITAAGWRNLTTTPKGEDALRIIRGEE